MPCRGVDKVRSACTYYHFYIFRTGSSHQSLGAQFELPEKPCSSLEGYWEWQARCPARRTWSKRIHLPQPWVANQLAAEAHGVRTSIYWTRPGRNICVEHAFAWGWLLELPRPFSWISKCLSTAILRVGKSR